MQSVSDLSSLNITLILIFHMVYYKISPPPPWAPPPPPHPQGTPPSPKDIYHKEIDPLDPPPPFATIKTSHNIFIILLLSLYIYYSLIAFR